MKRTLSSVVLVAILGLTAGASAGGSASFQNEVVLPAASADGGPFSLNGVVGQAASGTINGGNLTVHAGFHAPEGVNGPPDQDVFSDGFE